MNTSEIVLFSGFYGSVGEAEQPTISYPEFARQKPVLYGQIMSANGVSKIGSFRPVWNKWSNSMVYNYYSPQGNKGKGGFTLMRAWKMLQSGGLSVDPKYGNPETYL